MYNARSTEPNAWMVPFLKEIQMIVGTRELANHLFFKHFQFVLFTQWYIRSFKIGMGNAIYKERLKYTYHCYKILWEDIRSLRHRCRMTLYPGEMIHEGMERSDWLSICDFTYSRCRHVPWWQGTWAKSYHLFTRCWTGKSVWYRDDQLFNIWEYCFKI